MFLFVNKVFKKRKIIVQRLIKYNFYELKNYFLVIQTQTQAPRSI